MANKKITELANKATAAAADIVPIVDPTDNTTKRTTVGGFLTALLGLIPAGGILKAMIQDASIDKTKIDFSAGGGVWWEELARTTPSATAASSVNLSFTPKKFTRIIGRVRGHGSTAPGNTSLTLNNDGRISYQRILVNGATGTLTPVITASNSNTTGIFLGSIGTSETIFIDFTFEDMGSGNFRALGHGKVSNGYIQESIDYLMARFDETSSTPVSSLQIVGAAAGLANVEIVVLGHD